MTKTEIDNLGLTVGERYNFVVASGGITREIGNISYQQHNDTDIIIGRWYPRAIPIVDVISIEPSTTETTSTSCR